MQMSLAASICGTRRRLMRCILPQMSHAAVGILICTSTKFLYRMTLVWAPFLVAGRHNHGSQSRRGLITWNSAIIENTQDNISKSSVFIDADVLGCINMRHQTTFNALYSAPDEPCGCRNSHMHINEIFVSNDPAADTQEIIIGRNDPEAGEMQVHLPR